MLFVTIEEFLEIFYSHQSKPSRRKILELIKHGVIPAKKLGKVYYIDVHQLKLALMNKPNTSEYPPSETC